MTRPRCAAPIGRTTRLFLLCALCLGVGTVFLASPAGAQGNATLAEALFDEARKQFEAGNYETACNKFAESQRVDPATGTLLNLAICYEKAGRLATAWSTWREAASSARAAGQSDRESHARDMADKLESQVARLTVTVTDQAHLPDGFVLRQDGTDQPTAAWGVPLPVDAGTLHFEASAPGYLKWETDLEVLDGQTLSLSVPPLEKAPETNESMSTKAPSDTPPSSTGQVETDPAVKTNPTAEPQTVSGLRIWGIALTGVGAASLGAGTYFGIRALQKNSDSLDSCNQKDTNLCSRSGEKERKSALVSANLANILIGVGAVAATTGVVLWITSDSGQESSVAFAPTLGGAHLSLQGAF